MLVLNSTPLNQYIGRNPEYFFGASAEEGRINPEREASLWGGESLALGRNLHILISHIKCAAFELPIESDETFGSENLVEIFGFLETQGFVHRRATRGSASGPACGSAKPGLGPLDASGYSAGTASLRSVLSDPVDAQNPQQS